MEDKDLPILHFDGRWWPGDASAAIILTKLNQDNSVSALKEITICISDDLMQPQI